jgi:integrase
MPLVAGLVGLRWGEVAGLQVGDCDLLARRLHVRRQVTRGEGGRPIVLSPKTAAGVRSVAIPAALADELAAHLARRGLDGSSPEAWVFGGREGPLWYQNWRTRIWVPACRAAGLAGLRFHDLRALAATVMARTGVDVRTAMTRLGHTNVATTLRTCPRGGRPGRRRERGVLPAGDLMLGKCWERSQPDPRRSPSQGPDQLLRPWR